MADDVEKMVNAANEILKEIKTLTDYDPATKKAGLLRGNPELRDLQNSVLQAVASAVGGKSAAAAGLQLTRDGTLKFDKAQVRDRVRRRPRRCRGTLPRAPLAPRASRSDSLAVSDRATKFGTGVLSQSIEMRRNEIKRIDDSIATGTSGWRAKEARLRRQFAALETALGQSQQQGNWLAGQLVGLPSWNYDARTQSEQRCRCRQSATATSRTPCPRCTPAKLGDDALRRAGARPRPGRAGADRRATCRPPTTASSTPRRSSWSCRPAWTSTSGTAAPALMSLYNFMHRELVDANVRKDVDKVIAGSQHRRAAAPGVAPGRRRASAA